MTKKECNIFNIKTQSKMLNCYRVWKQKSCLTIYPMYKNTYGVRSKLMNTPRNAISLGRDPTVKQDIWQVVVTVGWTAPSVGIEMNMLRPKSSN